MENVKIIRSIPKYSTKKIFEINKMKHIVYLALISSSLFLYAGNANAACTGTGTVYNCTSGTGESNSMVYGGGVADTVNIVAGSTVTGSSSAHVPVYDIDSIGAGDLTVNLNSSTIDAPSAGFRGNVVDITQNTLHDGDINVNVESGSVINAGPGGQSAAVSILQAADNSGDINYTNNGGSYTAMNSSTAANADGRNMSASIISSGDGDVNVNWNGGIHTAGTAAMPSAQAHGVQVIREVGSGNVNMSMTSGQIDVTGAFNSGLFTLLRNGFTGDANVNISGGSITATSTQDTGLIGAVTVNRIGSATAGDINFNMSGGTIAGVDTLGINEMTGVYLTAQNNVQSDINFNMSGGAISGDGASAVHIVSGASADSVTTVNLSGDAVINRTNVTTNNAHALSAIAFNNDVNFSITDTVQVSSEGSSVVHLFAANSHLAASVTGGSLIAGATLTNNNHSALGLNLNQSILDLDISGGEILGNGRAIGVAGVLAAGGVGNISITGGSISGVTQALRLGVPNSINLNNGVMNVTIAGDAQLNSSENNTIFAFVVNGDTNYVVDDNAVISTPVGAGLAHLHRGTGNVNFDMRNGTITSGTLTSSGNVSVAIFAEGATNINSFNLSGGLIELNKNQNIFGYGVILDSANALNADFTGGTIDVNNVLGGAVGISTLVRGAEDSNVVLSGTNLNIISPSSARGVVSNSSGVSDANLTVTGGSVTIDSADASSTVYEVGANQGDTNINVNGGVMTIVDAGDGIRASTVEGQNNITVGNVTVISGDNVDNAAIKTLGPTSVVNLGDTAIVDGSRSGTAILDQQTGQITVNSTGTVTGDAVLGLGNDVYNHNGGSFTGTFYGDERTAAASGGMDMLNVNAGNFNGDAFLGGGNDALQLNGGSLNGDVFGEDGNDTFEWSGGSLVGGLYGGDGSDTFLITSATYDGSQILDGGDDTSTADGFIDTLTLQNLNVDTIGANILNFENVVIDGGRIGFVDNQLTAGNAIVTNGGMLDAGSMFILTGSLTTEADGVFEITGGGSGVYEVTGNVTNNSIINAQDNAVGDVLNIGGNYSGTGQFLTDINTDTNTADSINIAGNASGSTLIGLNDLGSGQGQDTGKGPGAGIKLVTVGGSVNQGAFGIEGGEFLVGPYRYELNLESDNTFYLQSELIEPVVVQRELAFTMVNAINALPTATLRQVNVTRTPINNDLNGRSANCMKRNSASDFDPNISDCRNTYNWIRVDRSELDMNAPGRTASFKEDRSFVHLGFDKEFSVNTVKGKGQTPKMTRWLAGMNGHVGGSNVNVDRTDTRYAGGVEKDFQGVGFSATRYNSEGSYQDYVIQISQFDGEINSVRGQTDIKGSNLVLSAETGKIFQPWGEQSRFSLVPQAQLVWNKSSFENYKDPDGVDVHLKDGETSYARLGVNFEWEPPVDQDLPVQERRNSKGYINTSVFANLDKETAIIAEGVEFKQNDHDSWLGLSAGGHIDHGDGLSTFGQIGYRQSLDDFADSRESSISIGIRKAFSGPGGAR